MSVHMQAVSAANREAIPQLDLMDSMSRLQETLKRGEGALGKHTVWSAQWAAVCVGRTVVGPLSPCSKHTSKRVCIPLTTEKAWST